MANILSIDTSTEVGSVAFSKDGNVIFNRESFEDRSHAVKTGVYVDEVLSEAEKAGLKPDAVAVCSGPGSYTGLRIGVSLAKGLCYGYNIPLIAIDTHTVLTQGLITETTISGNPLFCPMIDARRMEVYYAVFDAALNRIKPTVAEVIDSESLLEYRDNEVYFFGNGAEKCMNVLSLPNMQFVDGIHPMAKYLAVLAEKAFNEKQFENVAYFEPFYLKNFVATISTKNVLGK
ncbi:tRNA (adenosine(37)-N6)-threonylcarbamoyltransferase complex dimerization subunit type 1 TsaB [Saccharicrinis sp. FJH2]|uniref:tRNA (adenosine(37)-N6)-threonylcarbamoyltransferase complex dimerization subunit type 1 TsaB n=1 Tax=unclassified Saccharicrinis TaxID=2646859 RepID=UPI0035D3DF97